MLPERLIVLSVEYSKMLMVSTRIFYGMTCHVASGRMLHTCRAVRKRLTQGQLREVSVSPGAEILLCAQNDMTGIGRESS
jgi:hypothetical protein